MLELGLSVEVLEIGEGAHGNLGSNSLFLELTSLLDPGMGKSDFSTTSLLLISCKKLSNEVLSGIRDGSPDWV